MKKIFLLCFSFLICILSSLASYAENFYIKNYDVNIDIQKNKDIVVTEYIDVFFTKPSHGIFRSIPTTGSLYRNGENISYKATITDVRIDEQYTTSHNYNSHYTVFKIGNPNKRITGNYDYTIQYKYSMGNDTLKNNDEFYFNIIGTEWKTKIQKVNFKIKFPKEDYNLVQNTGFSMGRRGTSGYNPNFLKISINENKTITGYTTRILNENEGLTIRTLLPDNYFEKTDNSKMQLYVAGIMLLLTFIAYILWFIFGRDEKVITVVNFYPPKKRNSAEVGVQLNGKATHRELASLVMYLATKGYLEIDDDGVSYTLHKLKDYDGKNHCEKRLMNVIFKDSDSVTLEELRTSKYFYLDCVAILTVLNGIKNHLFDKNANSIEKMLILIVCILGQLGAIIYVLFDFSFDLIFSPVSFPLMFPIFGTAVVTTTVADIIKNDTPLSAKIFQGIFITIWAAGFIGMPLIFFILPMCNGLDENITLLLFGICCLIVSIICLYNMPKRNRHGRLVLGHILGFKKFLEVAEKHRLESLLVENPNYISDILPYAYVLGLSDKIMPLFEELSWYSPPTWYKGNFTSYSFAKFGSAMMNSSMPSIENGGITRIESCDSGFSGGGSSGGGGGGGGGGSW